MLYLFEALRLNDNRLYDTPENLQSCNLADVPELLADVSTVKTIFVWSKTVERHNVFAESC